MLEVEPTITVVSNDEEADNSRNNSPWPLFGMENCSELAEGGTNSDVVPFKPIVDNNKSRETLCATARAGLTEFGIAAMSSEPIPPGDSLLSADGSVVALEQ